MSRENLKEVIKVINDENSYQDANKLYQQTKENTQHQNMHVESNKCSDAIQNQSDVISHQDQDKKTPPDSKPEEKDEPKSDVNQQIIQGRNDFSGIGEHLDKDRTRQQELVTPTKVDNTAD